MWLEQKVYYCVITRLIELKFLDDQNDLIVVDDKIEDVMSVLFAYFV